MNLYVQQNQPPGVPPLQLTGERTLPDVPAENYWYRRHLVVYEWIGARVIGMRVLDMACGEGYGSEVLVALGRSACSAWTAIPRPTSTPACATCARTCASNGGRSRPTASPAPSTRSCSCRRSSTSRTRWRSSEHFRSLLAPGGTVYVSTPNLLTLAPPGAAKSDNPWHVREYRADEFRELCATVFGEVELLGLFHARKLAVHALAIELGWDRVHKALRLTKPFYDWFTPAIATSDFALRADKLDAALDFLAICRV